MSEPMQRTGMETIDDLWGTIRENAIEFDKFREKLAAKNAEIERLRKALEKIAYVTGDGHPLILIKVAREALAEVGK